MVSNVYSVDPTTIVFDDKYVVFNPLHNELEYEATVESIKRLGQTDPILMLNGKCIDGRHRTKAAKELGIMVQCVDIDSSLSTKDIVLLCNRNVTSGRDYDSAQKAIQALRLVNEYGFPINKAATHMKINRKLVTYAATIKGYGREDLLVELMKDNKSKVQLRNMERASRSLELIAKHVKAEEEEDTVVVDDSERVQWKPDAMIKTEAGKAWYYEMIEAIDVMGRVKMDMLLMEMANMKFKVADVEDKESLMLT